MKHKIGFNKIFIFILGIVFSFIIFEVALRIIGHAVMSDRQITYKSENSSLPKYKIQCLGNSYTLGNGAPANMSYPAQLERFLNERKDKNYIVYNRGLGNINSRYILENIEKWLEEDQPNIVFLMIGEPNSWNRYGYTEFLKEINSNSAPTKIEQAQFLKWSKVFKLFELLSSDFFSTGNSVSFSGLKSETEQEKIFLAYTWLGALEDSPIFSPTTLDYRQKREAIKMLSYLFNKRKISTAARLVAEIELYGNKSPQRSISWLKQAIHSTDKFEYMQLNVLNNLIKSKFNSPEISDLNHLLLLRMQKNKWSYEDYFNWQFKKEYPANISMQEKTQFLLDVSDASPSSALNARTAIQQIIHENPEKSIDIIKRVYRYNPLTALDNSIQHFETIQHLHPKLKEKIELARAEMKSESSSFGISLIDTERELTAKWVQHDLDLIIKAITKYGAKIVVQTYPPMRDANLRHVENALAEWRATSPYSKQVQFLDIRQELSQLFHPANNGDHFYSTEYGPTDNHLSADGNKEVAKLMMSYIQ